MKYPEFRGAVFAPEIPDSRPGQPPPENLHHEQLIKRSWKIGTHIACLSSTKKKASKIFTPPASRKS